MFEILSVSSDTILFGNRDEREDIEELMERLKRLPHDKFLLINNLINKLFEIFALLEK